MVTQIGPLSHLGSGVVTQNITLNLKGNQNYSLKVQVELDSQVFTSYKHHFSKIGIHNLHILTLQAHAHDQKGYSPAMGHHCIVW